MDSELEKDWISFSIESMKTLAKKSVLISLERCAISIISKYWEGSHIFSSESRKDLSDLESQNLRSY